jgi:hypothetical protein
MQIKSRKIFNLVLLTTLFNMKISFVFLTSFKKMAVVGLFAAVMLFIQSCHEKDPGPKVVLLTVNIDAGYFAADTDPWLFISDDQGRPIDVRHAKDSTHIKFRGEQRGSITLTIFTRVASLSGDGSTWNSFGFSSYQQMASGSTVIIKKPTGGGFQQIPEVIGSVPYTLNDYNDSDMPEQALIFSDGIATPYSVLDFNTKVYVNNKFSSQLMLRENPSKILVATYRDDVPVYQWLNGVKPGVGVDVNFDSFVSTKTISVNRAITGASVKSMNGANFATGYTFCELYTRQLSKSSNLAELPKLGYLDGFDKYFVSAYVNPFQEKQNINYTKAGTIPQSINLPEFTSSINSEDLKDLSITFSNVYSYKNAFFIKSSTEWQVNWNLVAGTENFKAPSIPVEVKNLYPMLNVDDIKLQFAAYTECLDGYTYPEYVSDFLASGTRDVYEELRYVILP